MFPLAAAEEDELLALAAEPVDFALFAAGVELLDAVPLPLLRDLQKFVANGFTVYVWLLEEYAAEQML